MMDPQIDVLDIFRMVMQWGIVPLVAFVFLIHKNQQNHNTEIAVLRALHNANKDAHDREFKEVKDSFKAVIAKLEGIEQHLRK
jgi:hypothetical protein